MIPETALWTHLSEKLWKARTRLYQHRFLQPNTHFAAFLIFRDLQDLHSFAPLESSYGKSLEKPTQKLRRKLKSENNDNANKQESNEVLQLPRRLRYTIRRMHSGAASHYQTAGRGACSQLQRETNHPSQMPMHIERRTHVN